MLHPGANKVLQCKLCSAFSDGINYEQQCCLLTSQELRFQFLLK